ncbi:WG repeat-containing protein [Psychrobacter frigidicola]|uniref:WG repeat-containing protein n=1 Tax=Psychrobacter frigidicola TaxID=45611 RepID=A0A5C7A3I4_9GAMM|nr:WG repeat-containing protein [Psychrobacter frigidicola]TXD97762.1 WG repeat-containing protein [Psychrobacter frigidicola]
MVIIVNNAIKKIVRAAGIKSSSALPFGLVVLTMMTLGTAQATISCAGYLPNSYFERIDDNEEFAGKLVELADGSQQLEDLNGNVILEGLTDAYILMDKYLWAQQLGANGKNYGIVTATGEVIVPFVYDNIATQPDISTSFIVSIKAPNGITKQGIIDRNGYWIYPKPKINQKDNATHRKKSKQRRVDNGYGDYSDAKETAQPIKAGDAPFNLIAANISHAHYDSDKDGDYFLVKSLSNDIKNKDNAGKSAIQSVINKTGLLDDQGNWVIAQQYDALYPLNACSGQPLYLQAVLTTAEQQQTALLDQNAHIIIPFAPNQNIELFNNGVLNNGDKSTLFLRSILIEGSHAIGMTEDIKDDIVSAQIINATGKLILSSDAPIIRLLYHQLFTYKEGGKYGLINEQGKIILKPQFDSYRDEADKVWVEKNGEMVSLDTLIKLD